MTAHRPPTPWHYYLTAVAGWALLFALITALAVTYEMRRLENDFLRNAAHAQQRILRAIAVSDAVLDGLSLALSNMSETNLRFERYARHLLVAYDHLQLVYVVRRVGPEELQTFLQQMRGHYGPDYSQQAWEANDGDASFDPQEPRYLVTFVAPHGEATDALLGHDLGTHPVLRPSLLVALSTGETTASLPIELPGGGAGYCVFQADFEEVGGAAALMVRADGLLAGYARGRLRISLRYESGPELRIANGQRRGRAAELLLPVYRDVRPVDGPERPYSLVMEHALDWRDLSPAPMIPLLALALLGLPAALAAAHRRHLLECERTAQEGLLAYRATHDMLTGLPNRELFNDRFVHACELARRRGTQLGILFLDLDKFKPLNDTYGHKLGDAALRTVADRVANALRKGDTVARQGGDEFLVLLEGIAGEGAAQDAAGHILDALSPPARYRGVTYQLSASIGIAVFPQDGADLDALLAHADAAMYQAKRAGGGRYHIRRSA